MKSIKNTVAFFFILLSTVIFMVQCGEVRSKRSYYGGYDMYNDDFWYAGRIIGMIVGILLLLCCCCLPCVCIAGIWFAGWFGLRQRRQQKNQGQATTTTTSTVPIQQQSQPIPVQYPVNYETAGNANYIIPNRQQPRHIHVESSPRESETSRVIVPGDQVMFSAEDRYYTSSTGPATTHRPNAYNSSSRY